MRMAGDVVPRIFLDADVPAPFTSSITAAVLSFGASADGQHDQGGGAAVATSNAMCTSCHRLRVLSVASGPSRSRSCAAFLSNLQVSAAQQLLVGLRRPVAGVDQ